MRIARRVLPALAALTLLVSSTSVGAAVSSRKVALPAGLSDAQSFEKIDCQSPGNCMAVGLAQAPSGTPVIVASQEVNGTWKAAVRVTLPSTPPSTGFVALNDLTCASASSCLLTATYSPNTTQQVVARMEFANGAWATGVRVYLGGSEFSGKNAPRQPLNLQGAASGCWAPRNCVMSFLYNNLDGDWSTAYLVETNGTWGAIHRYPKATPYSSNTGIHEFSCVSTSGCVAIGSYADDDGLFHLFANTLSNGTWGTQVASNGPSNIAPSESLIPSAAMCTSLTTCVVTGTYSSRSSNVTQFTATMSAGVLANAQQVTMPTGYVQKNNPSSYSPPALGCSSDGSCVISSWGYATSSLAIQRVMAVRVTNGVVGTATPLSLLSNATVTANSPAGITSVACASANHCVILGDVVTTGAVIKAFSVTMSGGSWQRALAVALPGDAHPRYAVPQIVGLHCFTGLTCTAVGTYGNNAQNGQLMTIDGLGV